MVEKYATKVLEKLPKYGKAGALAGVALLTLGALTGVISKHSYQAGKIDQKYIDQAKLENMTGTIIVEISTDNNLKRREFNSRLFRM